jgi:hypothetical protein
VVNILACGQFANGVEDNPLPLAAVHTWIEMKQQNNPISQVRLWCGCLCTDLAQKMRDMVRGPHKNAYKKAVEASNNNGSWFQTGIVYFERIRLTLNSLHSRACFYNDS